MPVFSHSCFSTIWKPAFELSKPIQTKSDTRKVKIVVSSETFRMLRRPNAPSSRVKSRSATPTSGRNVTVERMGQSVILASTPEHHPGNERSNADQHRKR